MSDSFEQRLRRKLRTLERLTLRRELPERDGEIGRRIQFGRREGVNFSSNDYLALASHPRIKKVQSEALRSLGAGAGGSRLICGNHSLYGPLEDELARWKDTEASLVFGSGFLTSLGVVPALTGGRDWILYDELSHRCLIEGARLSHAPSDAFPHNDVDELRALLEQKRDDYDAVLCMTEGVFSMDGDRAPLHEIAAVTAEYDAWLLVDEAHSAGVWGSRGAGLTPDVEGVQVAMGTLSKAFGGYGGYVAGSDPLREFLINRAGSFIYSTGLPPAIVEANRAALTLIRDEPDRRDRLKHNVRTAADEWTRRGIPIPEPPSQVLPLLTGSADRTMEAGRVLQEAGVIAVPIRYPTVPRKQGRVRISLRSDHTETDLERLFDGLDRLDRNNLLTRQDLWTRTPE